ncbi:MAG: VanZ family protein, partial [Gammaproteobacteria bacterium]|nr:VanZ family protein [Gammaproteobacteria bacterium]
MYGSLVPFDYRALPLEEALSKFLAIPYRKLGVGSRADWIANLVLYVPLGYLAAAWAESSARLRAWVLGRTLVLALFSLLVAVAVEFMQLFFPPRTVSLNDLVAEG